MLDIGAELKTVFSSKNAIVEDIDETLTRLAKTALTAMEPIIIAAIKAELTNLLGVAL